MRPDPTDLPKGDSHYIPDGVVHSAVFKTRTRALDFFADKNRYKPKDCKKERGGKVL